jgi:hypothetical protein
MPVPARLSLVTLGVADVPRATRFYEQLGWPLSSDSVAGEVSFFKTAGGILALWGARDLAADASVELTPPPAFRGFALAMNCDTAEQVDETLEAARAAGGALVRAAARAEWGGYTGYFADVDGHLWEVAYNPGWPMSAQGTPVLP